MSNSNGAKYDTIKNLPHHVSSKRRQMTNAERAAQFAPFAALAGYESAIQETARLTDEQPELTDDEKQLLNYKLQIVLENLSCEPEVKITYFCPDARKAGGRCVTVNGRVTAVDEYSRRITLIDKREIEIDRIIDLDGDLFP